MHIITPVSVIQLSKARGFILSLFLLTNQQVWIFFDHPSLMDLLFEIRIFFDQPSLMDLSFEIPLPLC